MKAYLFPCIFVLVLWSCSEDDVDNNRIGGSTGFPESAVLGYEESALPAKVNPPDNLISDGSFENGEWFACGGATIIEDAGSHSGGQMANLSNVTVCEEADEPFFSTRNAILIHPLDIEGALPELLTISFWVKAETKIPDGALKVYLANTQERFLTSLAGGQSIVSYFDEENIGSEWQQVKLYYENTGNSVFIGNNGPFALAFQLELDNGFTDAVSFFIDDVKVSDTDETFAQPEPLPEGLANYPGDSRILFLDPRDGNKVSSMLPNGSSVVRHAQIPTAFLNSPPQWYGNEQVTMGQKVFNPASTSDLDVVPASGTDVFLYNLLSNDEERIYNTVGDPGRYSLSNTANNKEAIDVEVRSTTWDLERNRGAFTVCARARTPAFVSDDVCAITIVDSNDFTVLNEELQGFNPVWSSSGRLGYYLDNAIYIADVNGNSVRTSKVFESNGIGGMLQVVDWSPDGSKIVFAVATGGVTRLNGELKDMFTITMLEVNSQSITPLLNVDHGTLGTNLSWSPDGNYILYTVTLPNEKIQLWWLEVATGKTGPLTTSIDGWFGYWSK